MSKVEAREIRFQVAEGAGEVGALLMRPPDAEFLYILGHGAGAPMTHVFLEDIAVRLAARRIATFRYNFPYKERGGGFRPDPPRVLEATVRSAAAAAAEAAGDLPTIAGGKSMGGRITSQAQAAEALPGVRGLAFLGFPLHPPGRPATKRAEHLPDVGLPTLFLQGTRDKLADLELLAPIVAELPDAALHIVEGADHGFHVLKRSGRTDDEVMDDLADTVRAWLDETIA